MGFEILLKSLHQKECMSIAAIIMQQEQCVNMKHVSRGLWGMDALLRFRPRSPFLTSPSQDTFPKLLTYLIHGAVEAGLLFLLIDGCSEQRELLD